MPEDDKPKRPRYTRKGVAMLIGFTLFVIYMVVPVVMWVSPLYQQVILVPFKYDERAYKDSLSATQIKPEDHFFPNGNGNNLHGWLYRKPGAQKLIVMHHGNAGNVTTRVQLVNVFTDMGASFFVYDYRGYGRSDGQPILSGLVDDGLSAHDYLLQKCGFKPEQIIHYGESIGSGVACEVAAKRKSGGLILQSPVGSLPRVGRRNFAFLRPYPDFLFPRPQFNNVDMVRNLHMPVLFVASKADSVVSFHDSEDMYNNARTPHKKLLILNESGHNSITGNDFPPFDRDVRSLVSGSI